MPEPMHFRLVAISFSNKSLILHRHRLRRQRRRSNSSSSAQSPHSFHKPASSPTLDDGAGWRPRELPGPGTTNRFPEPVATAPGSSRETASAGPCRRYLLPKNLVPKAAEYFAGDVQKFGHLTTGFVGTPLLCKTLSAIGRDDLAFMLLNNKKYPSWLYPVLQGATTIWERWDGQKPDGTFQDVGMNSFNHYAYGAIGEWLYRHVAGIDINTNHPGYKHILLAPHPGGGLKNATAEFLTLYGKVSSSWKFENDVFVYEVLVPANTTATITLPFAKAEQVTQDGMPVKAGSTQNNNDLQLNVGSGKYLFKYPAQALAAATAEKKK